MANDKIYRAAAIGRTGAGNFGHNLHLAYEGLDNVEFVAVADPDEDGRAKAQQRTGAPNSYADYREMLEQESLDIVSVCPRWLDRHLEMVLACVDAGCHVYCEKPIARTLVEADQMLTAAEAADIKIAVAHQGVYLPGVQKVKQMLEEGRLGAIQAIYANGKEDHRGGGEDMMVLGTHLFNMMRYFVGNVTWMFAHVTADGHEITKEDVREATEPIGPVAGDCINSYYAFESGVSGFFTSRRDQAGGGGRYGMEIWGSEGILSLRGGTASDVALYPHPLWKPSDTSKRWERLELDEQPLMSGNQLAIRDLIDAIEHDREPLSSLRDAIAALEMILGAYESQITGKRVFLPMVNRRHPLERLSKPVGTP